MMSSMPCLRSVPGATRSIEWSRRGSRRGSSSDGERVKPSIPGCLSALSGIEPRLDRVLQRVVFVNAEFAMRGGPHRDHDAIQAELRALLQTPFGLGGRPETAREADLAEGREPGPNGHPSRCRRDGERDREVGAGLVDANAAGDVD